MLTLSVPFRAARVAAGLALLFLAALPCAGQQPKAAEPTNAAEAAAKKAAEDEEIDAKYQALAAKLAAEEQAWERTLLGNPGGFYLPLHKRDKVRGVSNAWDFVADDPEILRVLPADGSSVPHGHGRKAKRAGVPGTHARL